MLLTFMLILLMTVATGALALGRVRHTLDVSKDADCALDVIALLRKLVELLAKHRGMSNAYLRGDTSFKQGMLEIQRSVAHHISELDRVTLRRHCKLARAEFLAQHQQWENIEQHIFTLTPEQSFSLHTQLLNITLNLMQYVAEDSALMDFSLASNGGVDAHALLVDIPQAAELLGQARGIGTGVATQGHCSVANRVKLQYLYRGMSSVAKILDRTKGGDTALLNRCQKSVDEFTRTLHSDLICSGNIMITPDAYYAKGTQAIEACYQLFDAIFAVLCAARKKSLQQLTLKSVPQQIGIVLLVLLVAALDGWLLL